MIDRFEIRVPSVVETEGDFEVEVRALDAQGAILINDSTTVVSLTPSDPNIVFDGNGDGTYGQVGDDVKTLTNGIAIFPARDIKSGTFTVDVEDSQNNTGSREFVYSFNCLILPDRLTEPPQGTSTLEANQFFRPRDTLAAATEDPSLYEVRTSTGVPISDTLLLPVLLSDDLDFQAVDIGQGNGTTVENLPNASGLGVPTQSVPASRATFNTNQINGQPALTFDGNDFYDFENAVNPLLSSEGDFTIVAAVRLLQSGGVQTIFSQYEEGVDNGKFVFRYDNGFELLMGDDGTLSDLSVKTAAQSINVPLYVLAERVGDTYSIELGLTQVASTPDGGTRQLLETGNLIGARSSSGTYTDNLTDFYPSDLLSLKVFPGSLSVGNKLDEFYAYEDLYEVPADNSTSYISTLQSSYNFDALYPHDDPQAGSRLRDVSGNGRNGRTVNADAEESPLLTDGGTAIEYGNGQFAVLDGFELPATTQRTFHFWVATNETVGFTILDQYLFDHESPRLALMWELSPTSGFTGEVGLFDTVYRTFNVTLPRGGATTLVSYVFNNTSCELFFNGVSQGTIAVTARSALLESSTTLFSRFSQNVGFDGVIKSDAVMIVNTAQTPADILDIYNNGIV